MVIGVDDLMDYCPWCGGDATGQDLLQPALQRVRLLLRKVRVPDWGYRILVRPGISGVDPRHPKIVEIERRLVERRDKISWPSMVGLIAHELGHSFLFHHWRFARSNRFRTAFGDVSKAYLEGLELMRCDSAKAKRDAKVRREELEDDSMQAAGGF